MTSPTRAPAQRAGARDQGTPREGGEHLPGPAGAYQLAETAAGGDATGSTTAGGAGAAADPGAGTAFHGMTPPGLGDPGTSRRRAVALGGLLAVLVAVTAALYGTG